MTGQLAAETLEALFEVVGHVLGEGWKTEEFSDFSDWVFHELLVVDYVERQLRGKDLFREVKKRFFIVQLEVCVRVCVFVRLCV